MPRPVGDDRLQRLGLPRAREHGIGDLLDRALDAGAHVVRLAGLAALEHELDRAAVVEHMQPLALVLVDAYNGSGWSSSACVVNSGITFSGNWNGP